MIYLTIFFYEKKKKEKCSYLGDGILLALRQLNISFSYPFVRINVGWRGEIEEFHKTRKYIYIYVRSWNVIEGLYEGKSEIKLERVENVTIKISN